MHKKKSSAIILLSGGQDSTTCLYWCKKNFKRILALSFSFGQKHVKELECAKRICAYNKIEHIIIDLNILSVYKNSNNCISGRNLFFLSFAALAAKYYNFDSIVIGVSQQDYNTFPDCRENFIKALNVALNLAMDSNITIYTPLMNLKKEDIWKMADDLGIIDIIKNETLTCYNGLIGNGCGQCSACQLRNSGYKKYYNSIKGEDDE